MYKSLFLLSRGQKSLFTCQGKSLCNNLLSKGHNFQTRVLLHHVTMTLFPAWHAQSDAWWLVVKEEWMSWQLLCFDLKFEKIKKKLENCTILIPKGNSYCRRKSNPRGLGLKSHQKDYQQKWTYKYGHPSKYKLRPMLLNPNVPGGWR